MDVGSFQNQWELDQLLSIVDALDPHRILEVGAMYGGTLWYWIDQAEHVVVVDDAMREADRWEHWAEQREVQLDLLQGLSQDPELVAKAIELGPYDFAFIDADHSYEAVQSDWNSYGALSEVVAFHDIVERPGYGVSRLWGELKNTDGARWVEIVHNATLPDHEGPCGIGVLWT